MQYTIFETFVGAGGSHIGFKKAGFKSVFVNDISKNCLKTLLFNNPEIKKTAIISCEDITKLDGNKILGDLGFKEGQLDVMFGGIVCKGFSLAGEKSPNDPRNNYYHYQLDLVKYIKPKISIIENVPSILSSMILANDVPESIKNEVDEIWQELENYKGYMAINRKKAVISENDFEKGKNLRNKKQFLMNRLIENKYLISVKDDILNIYEKLGYKVYIKILNSASYGAATKRDRAIIVAVRNDIMIPFEYPTPLFFDENKFQTVGEALSRINYNDLNDSDNKPMKHNEKTVRRLTYLGEGENFANIMYKLPNELKISKFYSRGSTMRLDSKKCAPTLVPGHSNFPIHPFENRAITVREASTITGFPIDYKFFGTHTERCEQVGNAVPPPLSYAIALQCKDLLNKFYKSMS